VKVLVLNPYFDAEHEIIQALERAGLSVLVTQDREEAWHILRLHGRSIDLAIVHREGKKGLGKPGIDFIQKFKSDSVQTDLPYILTTERWSETQCAEHQESKIGANAYLKWPFRGKHLVALTAQVMGEFFTNIGESPVVSDSSKHLLSQKPPHPPKLTPPKMPKLQPLKESEELLTTSAAIDISALKVNVEASLKDFVFQEGQIDLQKMPSPKSPETEEALLTKDSAELHSEMPYLFDKRIENDPSKDLRLPYAIPQGNAVVPGGATEAPDVETLKKYLYWRERDVGVLGVQLDDAKGRIKTLEDELKFEKNKNDELRNTADEQHEKITNFEDEQNTQRDAFEKEIEEVRFQAKAKNDKIRILDSQIKKAEDEIEKIRERVRNDIRRIRVRERELENRLEIMKKDHESLISSRDSKIIELKRKLDLVEYNMEILQNKYSGEKDKVTAMRQRLSKASQVVRLMGGVLDERDEATWDKEPRTNVFDSPIKSDLTGLKKIG
jgi:predicted  nucleic acid-binding Zn-ribbon protein